LTALPGGSYRARVLLRALLLATIVGAIPARADVAPAPSRVKLAALILKTGDVDQDLADNLTEVLIARLAERPLPGVGAVTLVGKEQLRARMGSDERRALACLEDMGCLGPVGVELGVTRVVVGTLGRRGDDYLYNLSLVDIASGKVESRVFQLVAGKVDALIEAVQATADRLFLPKVEPGSVRVVSAVAGAMVYLDDLFVGSTPVRRDGVEPGSHRLRVEAEGHRGWQNVVDVPAGSLLEISVPLSSLPERRRWPGPFATGTFAGALAFGVGGLVLGVLSQQQPPAGETRVMALADVSHRRDLAFTADGLFAAAGAVGITALVTFIAWRHDILGTRASGSHALLPPSRLRLLAEGRF
jgi:hypothetical protein